ncbi:MAG TPA: ABC transporter permease [Vicinamibacteria bacterium]|nr:ABC transporter permease [Vicinamibacteria bacterium]
MRRRVVSMLSVSAVLLLWELAPRLGLVDPHFTSQPSRILAAGLSIARSGNLTSHLLVSSYELAAGLALAILVGVPFGLLLGASRDARDYLDAPIMALYAAPRLALLPILVVWLGIGMASKVAVVFIGALLPIVINTVAGPRGIERTLLLAASAFGARRRDVLLKVLLPGSLPAVMSGIRLGMGRGLLGVVVGEMYVSERGVGNQIMSMGAAFRVDELLFYTLLVSCAGVALTSAMRRLEERLEP